MTASQVIVARDLAAYYRRAADLFVVALHRSKRPTVALSGGSTPKRLFELLAEPGTREQVAWDKVLFFWGDERCVPPDHAESNFKMANDALLKKVGVPAENVHRMKGELAPAAAASDYEATMKRLLPERPFPQLDFNLMGMGDDGHTASLFPGTAGLNETERWVVANRVEKLKTDRISLTFPALNHARRTVLMVTGANKAGVLAEVFEEKGKYPVERIRPVDGELIWLLDAPAAEKLPPSVRSSATYI